MPSLTTQPSVQRFAGSAVRSGRFPIPARRARTANGDETGTPSEVLRSFGAKIQGNFRGESSTGVLSGRRTGPARVGLHPSRSTRPPAGRTGTLGGKALPRSGWDRAPWNRHDPSRAIWLRFEAAAEVGPTPRTGTRRSANGFVLYWLTGPLKNKDLRRSARAILDMSSIGTRRIRAIREVGGSRASRAWLAGRVIGIIAPGQSGTDSQSRLPGPRVPRRSSGPLSNVPGVGSGPPHILEASW